MAGISALAAYGGDSSDSGSENEGRSEEFSLHLKPVPKEQEEVAIGREIAVRSAPTVITKVRNTYVVVFPHAFLLGFRF